MTADARMRAACATEDPATMLATMRALGWTVRVEEPMIWLEISPRLDGMPADVHAAIVRHGTAIARLVVAA